MSLALCRNASAQYAAPRWRDVHAEGLERRVGRSEGFVDRQGQRLCEAGRALSPDVHVCTPMLDTLEASDGSTELKPVLGVLDRAVECHRRPSGRFANERSIREESQLPDETIAVAPGAHLSGHRLAELQSSQVSAWIEHRVLRRPGRGVVRRHLKHCRSVRGRRGDEHDIGRRALDDETLLPVNDPVATFRLPRPDSIATSTFAYADRGQRFARRDPGQPTLLRRLIT